MGTSVVNGEAIFMKAAEGVARPWSTVVAAIGE
jgi:hypothetical protein